MYILADGSNFVHAILPPQSKRNKNLACSTKWAVAATTAATTAQTTTVESSKQIANPNSQILLPQLTKSTKISYPQGG